MSKYIEDIIAISTLAMAALLVEWQFLVTLAEHGWN